MQLFLAYATDLLLVTASLGAATYCMVLSRRLSRLGSFDKGIGSAIAVLSAQVEEMKTALGEAKEGSDGAGRHLETLVSQAQEISAELEMMIAACHDFAETAIAVQTEGGQGASRNAGPQAAHTQEGRLHAPDDVPEDARYGARYGAQDGGQDGGQEDPVSETGTPEPASVHEGIVPVFGSRRMADDGADTAGAVPMFRHRSGLGA